MQRGCKEAEGYLCGEVQTGSIGADITEVAKCKGAVKKLNVIEVVKCKGVVKKLNMIEVLRD